MPDAATGADKPACPANTRAARATGRRACNRPSYAALAHPTGAASRTRRGGTTAASVTGATAARRSIASLVAEKSRFVDLLVSTSDEAQYRYE